jgi:ubiquitin C-terminal hydrolase
MDERKLIMPQLGFHNTGAICYFNSLIQCLLSSDNFINFILNDNKNEMFLEFFKNILNDQWDSVFTTRLLQRYNIVDANQSSSEYFILLVDLLKLEKVFETRHKIITQCINCNKTKESFDTSYINLIDNDVREFFTYEEEIENVNCDFCKVKSKIKRNRIINGIPPIVVLYFNKYFMKKYINYPHSFSTNEVEYKLIGTVDHFGVLGGGHYISRVLRNSKNYIIDDYKVCEIDQIDPVQETYMAFYERTR